MDDSENKNGDYGRIPIELIFWSLVTTLGSCVTKEKLIKIIHALLNTDATLEFLQKLSEEDLETLVASIRDRIDRVRS